MLYCCIDRRKKSPFGAKKGTSSCLLPGDFFKLVEGDFLLINEPFNEEKIKSMKKKALKKYIKSKIKTAVLAYLNKEKESKSKVKNVQYKKFKLQKYMKSNLFSNYEVEILCKTRSRNLEVKENFKTQFTANNDASKLQCKVDGCNEIEDQQHILKCQPILKKLDKNVPVENISYNDIFSTPKKQQKVTKLIIKLLDIRESILNSQQKTTKS